MLAVGSGNAVLTLMRGSGSAAGFAFWLRGGKAHIFCAYFSSLAVQNPRFWLAVVALLFRQVRSGFAVPNSQFWQCGPASLWLCGTESAVLACDCWKIKQ